MEDQATRDGFNKVKDRITLNSLYDLARTRRIAGWLVGMNLNRLYSYLYQ